MKLYNFLFEEDLQSMRNSMENRSPYLDKDIFEYMLKVPTQYLISSGYSKKNITRLYEWYCRPQNSLEQKKKLDLMLL